MAAKPVHAYRIKDHQASTAWLMTFPTLIVIFTFSILPFIMAIVYSFTNKMLVSTSGNSLKFIGFDNYIQLFQDSTTYKAFLNTFIYTIVIVPLITIFALLLALLVNVKLKGITILRTIAFSPQILAMTVVAVAFAFIFSSSSTGMLNSLLKIVHIHSQTWLKDPKLALSVIIVMTLWQVVGLNMIYYMSGIQFIPTELYEAADIDGCTIWQKFINITIPLLRNTTIFVLISNTIFSLRLFTQVYVLTNGGPMNSTTSLVYLIYDAGFTGTRIGYASALSVIFFILVLIISVFQIKLMAKEEE
jgi:multiple sugar transport system permease protein